MPVWTLKLGSVVVTLASTAGFWSYVSQHMHPVRAPLKPKVVQPVMDTSAADQAANAVATPDPAQPAATAAPPVIVKKVVVIQQAQQQAQTSAALGASWMANHTGQQPVVNTHTS
jgi:hypothetical protein